MKGRGRRDWESPLGLATPGPDLLLALPSGTPSRYRILGPPFVILTLREPLLYPTFLYPLCLPTLTPLSSHPQRLSSPPPYPSSSHLQGSCVSGSRYVRVKPHVRVDVGFRAVVEVVVETVALEELEV